MDQLPNFGLSDGTVSLSAELRPKRLLHARRIVPQTPSYAPEYADLASYVNSGETEALLYAVTRSAEINQELLPKPCFGWARRIAKQFDAALLVAHSGTFMAFAIPRDEGSIDPLAGLRGMLRAKGFNPLVFQTGSLGTTLRGRGRAPSGQLFED